MACQVWQDDKLIGRPLTDLHLRMLQLRDTWRSSGLWQIESNQRIGGHNRDVLLAVPALIRDRVGVGSPVEFSDPELLAGLRLDGPEAVVVGRADEQDSSRGDDGAR